MPDRHPDDQHAGRLEQRAAPDLGAELLYEASTRNGDRDDVNARPMSLAEVLHRVSAPTTMSPTFQPAASTRLSTSIHQAMRLRAASAAAISASTNAHAKLVSGKLKM